MDNQEMYLLKKISGASQEEFDYALEKKYEMEKQNKEDYKLLFNRRMNRFELMPYSSFKFLPYDPNLDTFLEVDRYDRKEILSDFTPNKFKRDKFVYTNQDIKEAFYHLYEQGLA